MGSIKTATGSSNITHSTSVATALNSWSKLLTLKLPGEVELDSTTVSFIQKILDSVKMMEEMRLVFEAELDEQYTKTIKDVIKVCKEGKAAYDKVKQNRLELDGKK